jgi:biotin carboxyl carrier protein
MKLKLDSHSLELTPTGKSYMLKIDGQELAANILRAENGRLELQLRQPDGSTRNVTAYVSSSGAKRWVTLGGQTFVLAKSAGDGKTRVSGHHAGGELVSPMPGQVRAVLVNPDDVVTKGQTLVIVEAMKMEIKVAAPRDGKVKAVKVKPGKTVEREELMVEIE